MLVDACDFVISGGEGLSKGSMQEARGLIISDMHKADPHSSGSTNVLDLSSTYLSFFSETQERKKQLWSGRTEGEWVFFCQVGSILCLMLVI